MTFIAISYVYTYKSKGRENLTDLLFWTLLNLRVLENMGCLPNIAVVSVHVTVVKLTA